MMFARRRIPLMLVAWLLACWQSPSTTYSSRMHAKCNSQTITHVDNCSNMAFDALPETLPDIRL